MHEYRRDSLVWMAFLLNGSFAFYLNGLGPLTPFLRSELGLSYTLGSLHFTAFALGLLLVSLFGYRLIRLTGARRALWAGGLGMSASIIILVLGHHPVQTIGACLLLGLFCSLILSILPSVLSEHAGEARSAALTEYTLFASVVSAAAPLVVGFAAASSLGWRLALGLTALVPLALFALFGRIALPQGLEDEAKRTQTSLPLPRRYWAYWVLIVLSVSSEFCIVYWGSEYLTARLGMPKADSAQAIVLFIGGMILGRFLSSRLVRRIPLSILIPASALVALFGFALFWLPAASLPVLTGLFLSGLGIASLYPLLLSLAIGASGGQEVKAGSRASIASGVAILLLPLLLGGLADLLGIRPAYLVVPVLLLGVLMGLFRLNRSQA